MTLGVQLSLDNQWKVYLNLRRIWIILINLHHFKHKIGFLRLLECHKYLIVLDGPQNTDQWIQTCAFTVAYVVLWLEVLFYYSAVKVFHIRCATRGEGESLPYPFLKIKKKCPGFGKKGPNFVHPEVKFSIQNIVLRVSRTKSSKISCCGAFFLDFLRKCLLKYPNFKKPPLSWKISGCAPTCKQYDFCSLELYWQYRQKF